MKSFATTLILFMLLSACSSQQRFAERYLDHITLNIHMNRSFEVRGFLKREYSPVDALECQGIFGISQLSFACSVQDSMRLRENLRDFPIPTDIVTGQTEGVTLVSYRQAGISWMPRYSWSMDGDSCRFSATVILSNTTGREWFAERTTLMDWTGEPVCMIDDTLIVPIGDLELGWWRASGQTLPLTISYGWPNSAQWNQLVPCIVPEAGPTLDTGEYGTDRPMVTGDTLWVPPVSPLEISHSLEQSDSGYIGNMQIYNQTGEYREVRVIHPEILPRGARFVEGEDFPAFAGLFPGDLVLLEYRLVYDL